jgi:hypothetical protein
VRGAMIGDIKCGRSKRIGNVSTKKCKGYDMKEHASPKVTASFYKVIDNQLRNLEPPETKETYDRLISSGISDEEARRLIAVILDCEIYDMLKYKREHDQEKYIANLRKLPVLPRE